MGTTNAQNSPKCSTETAKPRGTDSIEAFYAGLVVLITGVTGFLGKALLEKLLRTSPELDTIYVLIRPKKDSNIEQRLQELINNKIFDNIRLKQPEQLKKIIPIQGDVSVPDLGISFQDKTVLIEKVNIVFHSAATIRFDEPLKIAVELNTRGTDRMIELCKSMVNLISLIHISTAYSNANEQHIKEAIYNTQIKPHTVMHMCDNLDDDTLTVIEKKLTENHPNTYTLTKSLAEKLILTKGQNLPIGIVRPSIVCAAYQEPFPGWIDNLWGITGILTEVSKGTVRIIVGNSKLKVDIIPVDFVVDTLICAGWQIATQPTTTIKVYNCTSSSLNSIRWGEIGKFMNKYVIESPSKYILWYPNMMFINNKILFKLMITTFHFIPAFVVDLLRRCQGKKPIMMRQAKRYNRVLNTGKYFTTKEWAFENTNMLELAKSIQALKDRNNFNIDIRELDWNTYFRRYTMGIRKYILNDTSESLNTGRNRLVKFYWIWKIIQCIIIFVIILKMLKYLGR